MIHDILNTSSVERLKGILRDRYGKGLEVSFLNDSAAVDLGRASSVKEGALQIPICADGQFLALAMVPEVETLSESSCEAIAEVVKLVLEPAVQRWVTEQQEENKNVSRPFLRFGGLEVVEAVPHLEVAPETSPVILISSRNPFRIPRIANLAHESTGRWAFVRWNDVRPQIRTVQDIREMGAMTLYVEDVLDLTDAEKDLLNQWVMSSNEETEPALILGSTMEWSQLLEQEILPFDLLHHAGRTQILADRLPSDRALCEEAIKLLLDKEATIHNH